MTRQEQEEQMIKYSKSTVVTNDDQHQKNQPNDSNLLEIENTRLVCEINKFFFFIS